MSAALLDVADLSVFYGKFRALHGVSLSIGEGEVVSIIGANGAGKSSLLKAIVGQVPRVEGTITFAGANLAGTPGISLPCGFSSDGLPIGLQLQAAPFEEERLLRAARMYERETDWHTKQPDW